MTTPLLDDDTIIALTTNVTVYEGCDFIDTPAPPPTPDPTDGIPFSITIEE